MFGMLVVVTATAILSVVAMVPDGITVKREFDKVNTELEHCNKLIHGYNER